MVLVHGYVAAIRGAQLGFLLQWIEKSELGGVCFGVVSHKSFAKICSSDELC